MSVSSHVGAALLAIALSACAHESLPARSTASSYLGGRAAQPGGFIPSTKRAAFEQAPIATRDRQSYLGGQAGQPYAWLPEQSTRGAHVEQNATCYAAGRAAQPFAGPTLTLVRQQTDGASSLQCRTDVNPSHF